MKLPISIIFKIVKNNPERKKFNIKICRQNSQVPIDDIASMSVSYRKLDFSSIDNLQESLRTLATNEVLSQLRNEKMIPENQSNSEVDSLDLDDLVGKSVSVPFGYWNNLREIDL